MVSDVRTLPQRRGLKSRPRRLDLPAVFYVKAAFYVLLSLGVFGTSVVLIVGNVENTSYIVVFSFLVLVLLSNLLSRKVIRLLRHHGHQ